VAIFSHFGRSRIDQQRVRQVRGIKLYVTLQRFSANYYGLHLELYSWEWCIWFGLGPCTS